MTKTSKPEDFHLDAILLELGEFGRYQLHTYLYILLPILVAAIYNTQYIFAALAVNHRCLVPECEELPPQFIAGNWSEWARPESCTRLEPLGPDLTCSAASFNQSSSIRCDAWVYERETTIVSAFDLACQEWKRTLVGTMHSMGLFFALPLTAFISDLFGRRVALILTASVPSVFGVIRAFSPNYYMYIALEFVDGLVGSGVYSTGFLLALELVGRRRRVLAGNLISCTYAMGTVLAALIAWAIPNWKPYTLVIYAPSILFVLYYFTIEESVRWLLSNGKRAEAARIIHKAAEVNKKKLSPAALKMLTEESKDMSNGDNAEPSFMKTVLSSKVIMSRLLICSFWWVTTTFIYYGLSINSVSLAGNMYVNYILSALVEIPGYFMSFAALDKFGRKRSIMTAFAICGVSLIIFPFVPERIQWLRTSLTMLGKLCISGAFSSIYIYTSELFPTAGRHRLLGFCSMIGRIGTIVAPQTPLLMIYMASLPYLLFGSMAIIASLLMILTPETLNVSLPDSIHQAENLTDPDRKPSSAVRIRSTEEGLADTPQGATSSAPA